MTCIACKKDSEWIYISSDSQSSWDMIGNKETDKSKDKTKKNHSKIYEENWMVIGACGSVSESNIMKLFAKNHKPKSADEDGMMEFMIEFKERATKKDSWFEYDNEYIIIYQNKIYKCYWIDVSEVPEYTAIWSWMFFALSALYLWFDTEKAVEVACEFDLYCWWKIQTIHIPNTVKKK